MIYKLYSREVDKNLNLFKIIKFTINNVRFLKK